MTMEALWTTQIADFVEAQSSNEFLVAGVLLALLGILVAALRATYGLLNRLFWRVCAWTVSIDNRDRAYVSMMRWLADTGAFARLRRVRLDAFDPAYPREGEAAPRPVLTPQAGLFWFVRDGALVIANRFIDDKPIPGGKDKLETLTFTILACGRGRGEAVFADWLDRAARHAEGERDRWPKLHSYGDWGGWNRAMPIRPRALRSVVTRDRVGERVLADARAFYEREAWYVERGVPWRRGYLLYGPPGTGKSSLIRAVASELSLDLAVMDLTGKTMTDAALRDALSDAPDRAALVLEDIDAAFQGRERGDAADGLTFSGLLNALDGLAAQEGRIVFMTTNHRDRLDPALIRPGRADLHVPLEPATPAEAAAIYALFFPDARDRGAELRAELSGEAAPAAVQAALLAHAEDPDAAFEALRGLYRPKPAGRRLDGAAIAAE